LNGNTWPRLLIEHDNVNDELVSSELSGDEAGADAPIHEIEATADGFRILPQIETGQSHGRHKYATTRAQVSFESSLTSCHPSWTQELTGMVMTCC
jgi:hypothetical protein